MGMTPVLEEADGSVPKDRLRPMVQHPKRIQTSDRQQHRNSNRPKKLESGDEKEGANQLQGIKHNPVRTHEGRIEPR